MNDNETIDLSSITPGRIAAMSLDQLRAMIWLAESETKRDDDRQTPAQLVAAHRVAQDCRAEYYQRTAQAVRHG